MKKICYITTVPSTLNRFVLESAKYMQQHGKYDITFISSYDENFEKKFASDVKYIPVSMKRGVSFEGVRVILQLYKIFKKEKYDIIQYSTPNASCYASIAAFFAGTKIRIYCQWGIVYVGFKGIKRKVFKLLEKLVCKLSTNIQPDSRGNLLFSFSEKLYTEKKGAVIWNGSACGVDLKKFNIVKKDEWRKEIRSKYEINQEALVFGFVGRLTRDKGINELFYAAKEILQNNKNIYFLLIGSDEGIHTLNHELIAWAQACENVIFCGKTEEVEKYYCAMDMLVLPSYREGFGSVVIEAESMGVPVIVSDIPGPTDAMLRNITGVVVKKADANDLYQTMQNCIAGREKLQEMSLAAYKYATENFKSQQLFQYILENRNSLLKSK